MYGFGDVMLVSVGQLFWLDWYVVVVVGRVDSLFSLGHFLVGFVADDAEVFDHGVVLW